MHSNYQLVDLLYLVFFFHYVYAKPFINNIFSKNTTTYNSNKNSQVYPSCYCYASIMVSYSNSLYCCHSHSIDYDKAKFALDTHNL